MIRDSKYCLVKYLYWESTNKHLDCGDCMCDCIYSGKHHSGLLPTKRPENKGAVKK